MDSIFDTFLSHSQQPRDPGAITVAVPLPAPRCEVSVRSATLEDFEFIDSLQKMHSHMVGFFNKKTLEKYVTDGHVIIAEDSQKRPVGYCIAKDQYLKRDDVGIVYQLNVAPIQQRNLIGATLIKATFDRAAYGCKLFCCWCAQDIRANYFWESIGFSAIAFRTGSRAKQRIHIFWQKRIREGDQETAWWYPYQTQNGAVAEDRLVLPIPPGTHWRDAKPLVLPGLPGAHNDEPEPENVALPDTLPGGAPVKPRPESTIKAEKPGPRLTVAMSQSRPSPPEKIAIIHAGGVKYVAHPDYVPPPPAEKTAKSRKTKPRPRMKHDPKQVGLCRELRDRYLDALNTGRILPPASDAKYEVARQLEGPAGSVPRRSQVPENRLLDAA